ncbi:hypothetical protein [Gemmatimonas sp.]|uniref:hypothetical protein n=1 Tax=Gemmatimonas sp. TaxID=1962908 RepID=UPI003DA363A0
MLEALANALNTLLYVLRPVVFGTGVLAGIGAVASVGGADAPHFALLWWGAIHSRACGPGAGGAYGA